MLVSKSKQSKRVPFFFNFRIHSFARADYMSFVCMHAYCSGAHYIFFFRLVECTTSDDNFPPIMNASAPIHLLNASSPWVVVTV
jgi:hypothetical protein